ncbi:MAG TPA: hypothetical protein VK903_00915, partial [Propionicimonas sp.]|nr:hypothetical protein [Propionicimonas sp.]
MLLFLPAAGGLLLLNGRGFFAPDRTGHGATPSTPAASLCGAMEHVAVATPHEPFVLRLGVPGRAERLLCLRPRGALRLERGLDAGH